MDAIRLRHLVVDDSTPSRLLAFSELCVGDSVSQVITFTTELREAFHQLARDNAPIHGNVDFARARGYDGPILQGLCVTSRFSRLIGMYLPGESAVVESFTFKFRKPVYEGRLIEYRVEVMRMLNALQVVRLRLTVESEGQLCIEGEAQCLLRKTK